VAGIFFLVCWPLASYCITTGRPSSRRPGPGCAPTPPCASPQQASATAALYEQSRPAAQPSALTYTDRCGPYSGAAADRLPRRAALPLPRLCAEPLRPFLPQGQSSIRMVTVVVLYTCRPRKKMVQSTDWFENLYGLFVLIPFCIV